MKHLHFLTFLLAWFPFSYIFSQQVQIDSAFGTNGKLVTHFPNFSCQNGKPIFLSDGKLLIGGWQLHDVSFVRKHILARYNSDWSTDTGFGTGGVIQSNFGITTVEDMHLQSDGKIVLLATKTNPTTQMIQPAMIRYNPNGVIDSSFGINGLAQTNYTGDHVTNPRMLILSNDKIIVTANQLTTDDYNYAVSRFNANGTLDSQFSGDGQQIIDVSSIFGQSLDFLLVRGLQPDGKLIVGGNSIFTDSTGTHNALVRIKTTGQTDAAFGTAGKVIWKHPIGNYVLREIEILPDNKILCALMINEYIYFARFESNGTPDLSFANGGFSEDLNWTIDSTLQLNSTNMAVAGDKIYIAGQAVTTATPYTRQWFLGRFNAATGKLDSAFANNGVFILPETSPYHYFSPHHLTVLPDSKLLMMGQTSDGTEIDLLTVRIITDLNVGVIDQQNGAENTLLYPNPIRDHSTLKYTLNNRQKVSIHLINNTGQTVTVFKDQDSQDQGEYQIPLEFPSQLPPGIYFLNIKTETGATTVKIMKN